MEGVNGDVGRHVNGRGTRKRWFARTMLIDEVRYGVHGREPCVSLMTQIGEAGCLLHYTPRLRRTNLHGRSDYADSLFPSDPAFECNAGVPPFRNVRNKSTATVAARATSGVCFKVGTLMARSKPESHLRMLAPHWQPSCQCHCKICLQVPQGWPALKKTGVRRPGAQGRARTPRFSATARARAPICPGIGARPRDSPGISSCEDWESVR